MAKDKERRNAHDLYVNYGKSGKDIAQLLEVQEKTISKWVNENGWKSERDARTNSAEKGRANLEQVIANIAEQRLEIDQLRRQAVADGDRTTVLQYDKEAASLADQVAKMNKTLLNFDKNNRLTLAIYLEVMDDVFSNLRAQDEKLHNLTLDFQESHSQFISKKLG
jgi:transposase